MTSTPSPRAGWRNGWPHCWRHGWRVLLGAALALQLGCATPDPSPPADLPTTLSRAADRHGVCGAVVATVKHREPAVVEVASGTCDTVPPPRPDSVFQAASLSKPVFAYAVLKLVQQGRLSLDAPIVSYLGGTYRRRFDPFASAAGAPGEQVADPRLAAVTVRMALNHTSGLPNWSRGPLRFGAEPGAGWQYSGEGYVLLQRAVEAVTGQRLDRHLAEHVFQPLGMAHSSFVWEERFAATALPGTQAGVPMPLRPLTEPVAAATLHTTAPDYARFLAALLRDRALLDLVTETTAPVDARLQLSWGNGWGVEQVGPHRYLWQWGNNPGYRAFAMADPDSGDGFVLLTNSDRGLALAEPVARAVLPDAHRVFGFHLLRP